MSWQGKFAALGLVFLALFFVGTLGGCGDPGSDFVGESCREHNDCPGSARCLKGSRFPGGTCATACDSHSDCPYFASCIDRDGGVCLPECDRSSDCRRSYSCESERNYGSGGRSRVCIGD